MYASLFTDDAAAPPDAVGRLIGRIKTEFEQIPGLSLTAWDAARVFGVEPLAAEATLGVLVALGYVQRAPSGHYRCP